MSAEFLVDITYQSSHRSRYGDLCDRLLRSEGLWLTRCERHDGAIRPGFDSLPLLLTSSPAMRSDHYILYLPAVSLSDEAVGRARIEPSNEGSRFSSSCGESQVQPR
jgi:hypothetical protein